jgi:nucleoside-diphosphate-sugar epimerase
LSCRILITGANGFLGKKLVDRLLHADALRGESAELTLVDLQFERTWDDPRVSIVAGSIAEPATIASALTAWPDVVFHMACVPGGASEKNFDLGLQVNLNATLALLEGLRRAPKPPVFIYTSSVGVFGDPPAMVTDETPPSPRWSYGAHKAIGEVLVSDYTRKGWIDGRALRLPGIVARPPVQNGAITLFQSDIIRELSAGRRVTCPVGPAATPWWMSAECCVDNLVLASRLDAKLLKADRTYTLPLLRVSIQEVVTAIAAVAHSDAATNIDYRPDAAVEAQFGRLPPVEVPMAEALGLASDGTVEEMVRRALL